MPGSHGGGYGGGSGGGSHGGSFSSVGGARFSSSRPFAGSTRYDYIDRNGSDGGFGEF